MGYRKLEHKRHEPRRTAVNIATPIKLFIHNGETATFAFPCWYQEVKPPIPARLHNHYLHDHHGWPNPSHPDHSCQLWIPEVGGCIHGFKECSPHCRHYIDYSRVLPIHLLSEYEGYEGAFVSWIGEHEGIVATARIDEDEDWVVKVDVDCKDPNALEEPQRYKFTAFVGSDKDGNVYNRRDIVALAELIVLPSAY